MGAHRHCLVSGEFLDLFDGGSRHRQPGAERVTVAVPHKVSDLRLLQTGLEPRASIKSPFLTFPWEHTVARFLTREAHRLDCTERLRVQVDGSALSDPPIALAASGSNHPALRVKHSPGHAVLLGETRTRMDREDKLTEMFRKSSGDHLVEAIVFTPR